MEVKLRLHVTSGLDGVKCQLLLIIECNKVLCDTNFLLNILQIYSFQLHVSVFYSHLQAKLRSVCVCACACVRIYIYIYIYIYCNDEKDVRIYVLIYIYIYTFYCISYFNNFLLIIIFIN